MDVSRGTPTNGPHLDLEGIEQCLIQLSQNVDLNRRNLSAKEAEYKRTINRLEEENRTLISTVEQLTEKIEQKTIESGTAELKNKNLRVAELEKELRESLIHSNKREELIQQMQLKKTELGERAQALQLNLEKNENEVAALNSAKNECDEQNYRLEKDLEESQSAEANLKQLLEQTNLRKAQAGQEITRLKNRIREMEKTTLPPVSNTRYPYGTGQGSEEQINLISLAQNRTSECEEKLHEKQTELTCMQQELEETKTRLSKLMGQKLTDANPNIADLSDRNRPTKLAERYSELYDNQWTDAFETLDRIYEDEQRSISHLVDILKITLEFCHREANSQMISLKKALLLDDNRDGDRAISLVQKQLKDCRKTLAETTGSSLFTKFKTELQQSNTAVTKNALAVDTFLKECFFLCWLMCVQDPPVVFDQLPCRGDRFDTDVYRAYTRSGPFVDFVVWPALYLHAGGPILCKGIAQGLTRNSCDARRTDDTVCLPSEQVSVRKMGPDKEELLTQVVNGKESTKANAETEVVTPADINYFCQLLKQCNSDKTKMIGKLGLAKFHACYEHVAKYFGTCGLPPL